MTWNEKKNWTLIKWTDHRSIKYNSVDDDGVDDISGKMVILNKIKNINAVY